MSELNFKFLESKESNDHQVRILVDGSDILEIIDNTMLGIDPVEFFAQKTLTNNGELLIGRCGCGAMGCSDLEVRVDRQSDIIQWTFPSDSAISVKATSEGKISYPFPQYNTAIKAGASDTSWETLERTAERLVSQINYSDCLRDNLIFEWASARIGKDKITVSFIRNGEQILYDAHWNHKNPQDAVIAIQDMLKKKGYTI